MGVMNSENIIIRSFEEKDREAIRTICKETGQKGNHTWVFFEDEEIVPMLYADYYMDYEPESCIVAEVAERIVGYMVASKDTRHYNRIMLTRIYPRVCARSLWRLFTLKYRKKQTYQTLWWIITRSWREMFHPPFDQFPGHVHFNVDSAYRGQGIGKRLSSITRRHLIDMGVRGSHSIVREEEGNDTLSGFLCREGGYRVLKTKRNTVWEKATGKRWYAKLLVRDL